MAKSTRADNRVLIGFILNTEMPMTLRQSLHSLDLNVVVSFHQLMFPPLLLVYLDGSGRFWAEAQSSTFSFHGSGRPVNHFWNGWLNPIHPRVKWPSGSFTAADSRGPSTYPAGGRCKWSPRRGFLYPVYINLAHYSRNRPQTPWKHPRQMHF